MTIQGKVETPAPATAELDEETLRGIRDLLTKEETAAAAKPPPQPKAPQAKPSPVIPRRRVVAAQQEPDRTTQAPPDPEPQAAPAKAAFAPLPQAEEYPASDPADTSAGRLAKFRGRIADFRLAPRHYIYLALALFVLLRPVLVIGLLVLSIIIMVGTFMIMGDDSFWRRAMALGRWYARKRPQTAARLHRRLDRFAVGWDQFLDRFPEGTVDGLYLPDFGELAEADARHDAALERRLSGLHES